VSMYTARCVVVRCDVPECDQFAEVLCREGATNTIPGWLEVYPFGTSNDLSYRKFICARHAKLLGITDWGSPAEVPLSQAIQNPRFQKPGVLGFMIAMDSTTGPSLLRTGAIEGVTTPQLPEGEE
jgi:hypothetical protein